MTEERSYAVTIDLFDALSPRVVDFIYTLYMDLSCLAFSAADWR